MKFPKSYNSIPDFKDYINNDTRILPVKYEHRIKIMNWRNEQLFHLRQKNILNINDQDLYYTNVVGPLFKENKPNQLLFSILYQNNLVGYGGLVHLNWIDKNCELSFLVKTNILNEHEKEFDTVNIKTIYQIILSDFILCMREITFKHLKFNRLFTETYSFRKNHLKTLEMNNFKFEGNQREKVLISGKYIDSYFHSIIKDDEK